MRQHFGARRRPSGALAWRRSIPQRCYPGRGHRWRAALPRPLGAVGRPAVAARQRLGGRGCAPWQAFVAAMREQMWRCLPSVAGVFASLWTHCCRTSWHALDSSRSHHVAEIRRTPHNIARIRGRFGHSGCPARLTSNHVPTLVVVVCSRAVAPARSTAHPSHLAAGASVVALGTDGRSGLPTGALQVAHRSVARQRPSARAPWRL